MNTAVQHDIEELQKKYGYIKVNLKHHDGSSEGIWAVVTNDVDHGKYKNNTNFGQKITVVACNQPLGWGDKRYGDEIIARTAGSGRPTASLSDQE